MSLNSPLKRHLVLYDGNCRICRAFKDVISAMDGYRRVTALPMQDQEALTLLSKIGEEKYWESFHLVTPLGRIYSGHEAVTHLFRLLPGGRIVKLIEGAPLGKPLIKWMYQKLARKKVSIRCGL